MFSEKEMKHMIDHMNADHVDAMHDYCRMHDIDTNGFDPIMLSIDANGFDIKVDEHTHRFQFPSPCQSTTEVREALVKLANEARENI